MLARVQQQPDNQPALLDLADYFLSDDCGNGERRQIRGRCKTEPLQAAYESLYFEGMGMDQPAAFIRRTLAALFMTGGFSHRETAQRILGELRVYAEHHGVDFDSHYATIRDLPGARRAQGSRRRFLLRNAGLFAALVTGLLLIQQAPPSVQIPLQIGLFAGLMAAQMALLYRYLA
jgi:hypothetical protein